MGSWHSTKIPVCFTYCYDCGEVVVVGDGVVVVGDGVSVVVFGDEVVVARGHH